MVPPQKLLAVILVPGPGSAPLLQHGSFVQKGFKDKGSGSETGASLCDAVMPENKGKPALLDGWGNVLPWPVLTWLDDHKRLADFSKFSGCHPTSMFCAQFGLSWSVPNKTTKAEGLMQWDFWEALPRCEVIDCVPQPNTWHVAWELF